MKEDLHHLTLTDHQLELLAIAYQTALHRANEDQMTGIESLNRTIAEAANFSKSISSTARNQCDQGKLDVERKIRLLMSHLESILEESKTELRADSIQDSSQVEKAAA